MKFFETFLLAFLRFVCQLFMNKRFYQKFKAQYDGISSLPYFLYDYLVFENAYRSAKKDNYNHRYLKLVHRMMIYNLFVLTPLILFQLISDNDALLFSIIGVSALFEMITVQVVYRKNFIENQ